MRAFLLKFHSALQLPHTMVPKGSGAVTLKAENSWFLSWWTAETLHVIWVYIWLGFTLQSIWWIISSALATPHHFLCIRDFPSEVFRKNCTEFLETQNFNGWMKKHLRFERLFFNYIPGLYKYIYIYSFCCEYWMTFWKVNLNCVWGKPWQWWLSLD